MKLLIVTQKVDAADSNLGFFIQWIRMFAKYAEQVTVICLEKGVYELPPNVSVFSLGKEIRKRGRSLYAFRFLRYAFSLRHTYESVFIHMNPEYAILGGLLWKLLNKRVALWYVHKKVDAKLRLAEKYVDRIFTASKESLRLPSKKCSVIGHGIDMELFSGRRKDAAMGAKLRLLTVGRIAPVKDLRTLILGYALLKRTGEAAELSIVGEPITDIDLRYKQELAHFIEEQHVSAHVHFLGSVPFSSLPTVYNEHSAFIHASRTGSIDKTVLEALASGLTVFTSSEAFSGGIPGVFTFTAGDSSDLATQLELAFLKGKISYNSAGREWVREYHDLGNCIEKVANFLSTLP